MKLFLEAYEIITLDDIGEEVESIRADITDKSEAEREFIKNDIKDIMLGIPCRLIKHHCGHDEGKACWTELI